MRSKKISSVCIGDSIVYHGRCEDVTRLCAGSMESLESESMDAVITDPPYLYLKHKLDIPSPQGHHFQCTDVRRVMRMLYLKTGIGY